MELRTVQVTRYQTPLREGGSLPALVEADDGFLYVLKFYGAGQGVNALIAELIGGEIARLLGLRIPEIVFAKLDEGFGRTEPDEEIQDLLKASVGLNLAVHYLQGAITFDATVNKIDSYLASKIVWLDCFITNMDRTCRNTNMLVWHKELWLIDHGAALYFHHSWQDWALQAEKPFKLIKDHTLLPWATELDRVDEEFKQILTKSNLAEIVNCIPDQWLLADGFFKTAADYRGAYLQFLIKRLEHSTNFVKEANDAREIFV